MQMNGFLTAAILASVVAATPTPTPEEVFKPGTADEGRVGKRGSNPHVNQLISDAERTQLNKLGFENFKKCSENTLTSCDKTMNCGHKVTGKGGSNGHGKWVPVADFETLAHEFCNAYQGTDVAKGHETSDTYPTSFSNGKSGYVVLAVYNQKQERSWTWNADTCYNAMIGPLGSHAKRDVDDLEGQVVKRDNCYGKNHNDYEGGYYSVDGIGAFGSEVYPN
ncbi:MAG: hypothetical protein M1812_006733 [Candelaria pacifica]|nr:MAG: hypothetical protein M1812_006733 [Candelaria pacifica]